MSRNPDHPALAHSAPRGSGLPVAIEPVPRPGRPLATPRSTTRRGTSLSAIDFHAAAGTLFGDTRSATPAVDSMRSRAAGRILLLVVAICWGCRTATHEPRRDAAHPLCEFTAMRRAAGAWLAEYPELRERLRTALSGSVAGHRLAWDNAEPRSGAPAEHSAQMEVAAIQIRVSSSLHPADQVVGLFYEALNAQSHREFVRVVGAARKGLLRRDEFVDGIIRVEHRAVVRLKKVFERYFILPAEVAGDTRLYRSILESPSDEDSFPAWHRSRPEYGRLEALYGRYFDDLKAGRPEVEPDAPL